MALSDLCWLATAAYGVHVLEEFAFDWRTWARSVLKLPVEWATFYVTNSLVIVLGIVSAEMTYGEPMLALGFPALMLINATFFHVVPFVAFRGRFSPGLITALILFYPMAICCYRSAHRAGVLTPQVLIGSLAIGLLLMAAPIVFLRMSKLPYFVQHE